MKRFPLHLLLTFFLVLPLAACDSDGDGNGNGNGNVGDVEVTISGDIEDSFSGNAFFVVDEDDEDGINFAIGLFSGAITAPTSGQVVVLGREGERPGPGTYTIDTDGADTAFQGGYSDFEGTGGDITQAVSVVADSGTLVITSSSSNRVEGSFTFTGRVFDLGSPTDTTRTATVEGEFEAEFVEEGDVPIFQ